MLTLHRPPKVIDDPPEADDPVDPPDNGDDDDGDDGDHGPWVTVATFWSPTEAHIARIRLESEGIDCVIVDEHLVATQWLWASALGGIKLQVHPHKVEEARKLLKRQPSQQVAQHDPEPLFDGQMRCPKCGSDDIYDARFSRRASFLSILLIGLPLPFVRRRTRCAACGNEWKRV